MILDILKYIQSENVDKVRNILGVKKVFRSFVGYFIENPHVYRFFYFHHLNKEDKPNQTIVNELNFEEQYAGTFEFVFNSGKYTREETNLIIKTLIFSLYGLLSLHFSDYEELTIEAAIEELDLMIEYLLREVSDNG